MRVEFHPAASIEAEDAQAWYEERSLVAASAFLRELSNAISLIREAPSRYPATEWGARRILFERFPFTLYYKISDEVITVVAVAHQKRQPGYWHRR